MRTNYSTFAFNDVIQRAADSASRSNNSYLPLIVNSASTLGFSFNALQRVIDTQNPYETEAGHNRTIANSAKKLDAAITDRLNKINEYLQDGVKDATSRQAAKTMLVKSTYDAEIRAMYQKKPLGAKLKAIQKATEENDRDTLAALLLAPTALTGIDKETASRCITEFQEKHAPEETAEIQHLIETATLTINALGIARKAVAEAFDPDAVNRSENIARQAENAQMVFERGLAE